ncbi:helix-turn-helix domain-containing protein [Brevibacillus marinus]|uniref:helix-turn-helix domain-containing protein n=1 Tax=Brevibacillus marinus TaxID=2496837 RepID=UPI000F83092B
MEAVRLHVEEKWTYRQITERFGIPDKDRVKKWVRIYRKCGLTALEDLSARKSHS